MYIRITYVRTYVCVHTCLSGFCLHVCVYTYMSVCVQYIRKSITVLYVYSTYVSPLQCCMCTVQCCKCIGTAWVVLWCSFTVRACVRACVRVCVLAWLCFVWFELYCLKTVASCVLPSTVIACVYVHTYFRPCRYSHSIRSQYITSVLCCGGGTRTLCACSDAVWQFGAADTPYCTAEPQHGEF